MYCTYVLDASHTISYGDTLDLGLRFNKALGIIQY